MFGVDLGLARLWPTRSPERTYPPLVLLHEQNHGEAAAAGSDDRGSGTVREPGEEGGSEARGQGGTSAPDEARRRRGG